MTDAHEHCPVCDATSTRRLGTLPDSHWFAGTYLPVAVLGGALYCCDQCGLKFRLPIQSEATYRKLYDNSVVTTWTQHGPRTDWDLIAHYLSDQAPSGASVLDFGCYTGGLLARLSSSLDKYGIEINEQAAAVASTTANAIVWPSLVQIPEGKRFDFIIASDVIEHTPNPQRFLGELSEYLNSTGALILTTGDANNANWNRFGANWWYCFYPEHISFISREWLVKALPSIGLQTEHCKTFRYTELPMTRLFLDGLLANLYGLFPKVYLGVKSFLETMFKAKTSRSVPGSGISRDHLFIVLRPKVHRGH